MNRAHRQPLSACAHGAAAAGLRAQAAVKAGICASVVSHGHGGEVLALLRAMAAIAPPAAGHVAARPARVIVTLNVPEAGIADELAATAWPFDLRLLQNPQPLGFGANHNRAFALDAQLGAHAALAVLNPDVAWPAAAPPFAALWHALRANPQAALAYPLQTDAQGLPQDHERLWPTPARLLRRHVWGRLRRGGALEVPAGQRPDWVNAAFMLLARAAFDGVGGFDEGYHMYCEDVDLCLRLQCAGGRLLRVPQAVVRHTARRASRRQWRHALWHVQSLWRLWRSEGWKGRDGRA